MNSPHCLKCLKMSKSVKKKQKTNTQQFFQHVKRKTGVRFCRWYLTCCLDTGHVVFLFPVQIPSMWCSIFLKCMASCHSLYKKKHFSRNTVIASVQDGYHYWSSQPEVVNAKWKRAC